MLTEMEPEVRSLPFPDPPLLGYPNYWYPLIASSKVGRRPVAARLLGEGLVLFRTRAGVAALADRCPHRGAQLSLGRRLFPDTLSCGYHGWTFNRQGDCLAALVEGPESKIPGKVQARAYATEERFGLVWVFAGEVPRGERRADWPPSLDEDLPPELRKPNIIPNVFVEEWNCNWRFVTENYPDMLHAFIVHRTSLKQLFTKWPAWGKMHVELLPDGKGLHVRSLGAEMQGNYPGLGKFPARSWWRVVGGRPKKFQGEPPGRRADVRMPGYIVLPLRDPYFGVHSDNVGWPVPIDATRTQFVSITSIQQPKSPLGRLAKRLWFRGFYGPLHSGFLNQDRRLEASQAFGTPERLSATDLGLIQWRRLAPRIARQAPAAAHPNGNGKAQ
jgi:nitrite reductase/ring-hydroxylating ferredoxin subunit